MSDAKTSRTKAIGILGGMGPEATAELYLRIIRIFQERFGAVYDSDFPEIIVLSLPIPDVVEERGDRRKIEEMLAEGAKRLEAVGANFIAVPCNTAAFFASEMREAVKVPVIDIVREAANEALKMKLETVGLLGTRMTIRSRIYELFLKDVKVLTLDESGQEETTGIILDVLAGRKSADSKKKLLESIRRLKRFGAEKVILGCTELPLLVKGGADVLDTLDILAESAVRMASGSTSMAAQADARQDIKKPEEL